VHSEPTKYFTLISKLNEENKDLPEIENRTDNIISDIQIRENEIEDILHTLDPQKASGPDRISYKMLKISPEKIAKPLRIIFNKSLAHGKYLSAWKITHVISIFKKGRFLLTP
jgi:hypothetical protein